MGKIYKSILNIKIITPRKNNIEIYDLTTS